MLTIDEMEVPLFGFTAMESDAEKKLTVNRVPLERLDQGTSRGPQLEPPSSHGRGSAHGPSIRCLGIGVSAFLIQRSIAAYQARPARFASGLPSHPNLRRCAPRRECVLQVRPTRLAPQVGAALAGRVPAAGRFRTCKRGRRSNRAAAVRS